MLTIEEIPGFRLHKVTSPVEVSWGKQEFGKNITPFNWNIDCGLV